MRRKVMCLSRAVLLLTTALMWSGWLPSAAFAVLPFERTENVYVSMWGADEIAVFSPEGEPLERFSADGLDGPRGIAFNPANGDIWVASELADKIFIFDSQHQKLRELQHPDFDEPVGVTFTAYPDSSAVDQLVYVSNSNGDEVMVFNQSGELLRRFSGSDINDPNCSAFMPDGGFFVSNRLGGSGGANGAVSAFDGNDAFLFDFTAAGINSLMAVARDPNDAETNDDDTIWVTSGGGEQGIYEFDRAGNLLSTVLPAQIGDGRTVVPQGIAFDSDGNFFVASFTNEVIKFDGEGNFLMRFPTGDGTARSIAFQGCQTGEGDDCLLPGADVSTMDLNEDEVQEGGGGVMFVLLPVFVTMFSRLLKNYCTGSDVVKFSLERQPVKMLIYNP